MANYKHGVYARELETSLTATVSGTAGLQVVVGTAPVNMLSEPEKAVNVPLLVNSYKEAVEAVGYNGDFEKFTLCEAVSAAFQVVGTGPLVLINVLDPAQHTDEVAETTIPVSAGVAILETVGILPGSLSVKMDETNL